MQEKDPNINDLLLLQPKSVTFGQYDISERQENILTLITESLQDRKSTRLNSSHIQKSRMPSSA